MIWSIKYSQNKTFVIDHPIQHTKYLVHACLEGPEAGVYYRGVENVNEELVVQLPEYASKIASDYSVQATQIKGKNDKFAQIATSEIEDNCFTIYKVNNISILILDFNGSQSMLNMWICLKTWDQKSSKHFTYFDMWTLWYW